MNGRPTKQSRARVAAPSFALDDLPKAHLAYIFLGAVLIVAAAALIWIAAANERLAVYVHTSAELLGRASASATAGTMGFAQGGGTDFLQGKEDATAAVRTVDEALRDSASIIPSATNLQARAVRQVAGSLLQAYGAVEEPMSASIRLKAAMKDAAPSIASLLRAVSASGKQNGALARPYQALLKLSTYNEAGFGPASSQPIATAIDTIEFDLASTEYQQQVSALTTLQKVAREAASTRIAREQLQAILDAAVTATTLAGNIAAQPDGLLAGKVLVGLAVVFAIIGLGLLIGTFLMIRDDFGRRFRQALAQFRANETSLDALYASAAKLARGVPVDLKAENTAPATRSIAEEVAKATARFQGSIAQLVRKIDAGSGHIKTSRDAVNIGSEHAAKASQLLASMAATSGKTTEGSALLSLDAQAAGVAAKVVRDRTSDGMHVVQDAIHRINGLRDSLQETSKYVKRLGERSQESAEIVASLETLSQQIHALALNASLEAGKAGEAGHGFRQLVKDAQTMAGGTAKALEDMSRIRDGMQADARMAAESVDRSTQQVVDGSNATVVAEAVLDALLPAVENAAALCAIVSDAVLHQGLEIDDLHEGVSTAQKSTAVVIEQSASIERALGDAVTALEVVRVARAGEARK